MLGFGFIWRFFANAQNDINTELLKSNCHSEQSEESQTPTFTKEPNKNGMQENFPTSHFFIKIKSF